MKSLKLIAGLIASVALIATSCEKEFESGEDSSKPVPSDLSYDVENSSTDVLALRWSARELIAKGATSFSIEICDDPSEPVNTYDDVIQTIKASEIGADGIGRASFTKGLSEFTEKYVRIRVHYGPVFSSWVFATDDSGEPAVLVTGHGIKDLDKPSVGKIELTDCPEGGTSFSIKADVSSASSASRVLLVFMDYAAQKPLESIEIDPSSGSYEHTFSDLTSGKLYQIRMLAEYDVTGKPTHVSDWTFAEGEAYNEETEETVISNVIQCGKGFVVVNGVPPTGRCAAKYSGLLVFQWTEYGFENEAKDASIPVKVALYKDAACKELVYGWTINKYEISGRQPTIAFSNLEPNTKYWFTCQDTESGLISDPVEAQTTAFSIVKVGTEKVKAGETALAENFSELYFGGYAMDFSPSPTNAKTTLAHPQPGTWDSADLAWADGNHGFFNTFGNQGAVQTTRFKDWAVIHGPVNGTGAAVAGDCCIRTGMFQMGAASGMPIVFTPELTNLEGLASVSLSFTVSSMWEKGVIKEASAADFQQIGVYTATGGTVNTAKSTAYGTLSDATVKSVCVVDRPAVDVKEPTWETKTVTINNVSPGTRIGIGAIRPDGKTGNQRFLLSGVTVKVLSYGVPTLTTPVLKSKEIGKNKASFVFETQEMAQSYELGYKKSGDSDYTYIESDVPEFNITGLVPGTDYLIKAVSKAGEYVSETPFYLEFTTGSVDYTYPLTITNVEDFVEWMTYGAEFTISTNEVILDTDLDLAGKTLPEGVNFGGKLSGNGHKIMNLTSATPIFGEAASVVDLTIDASCKFTASVPVFGTVAVKSTGLFKNVVNEAAVSYSAADLKGVVLVGGIVGKAYGPMTDCVNKGAVSVTTKGVMDAPGVGGLAGILAAQMTDCTNEGAVLLSATCCSEAIKVENIKSACRPAIGGLVGFGQAFGMTSCTNNGTVTLVNTSIDKLSATAQRQQIGGIAGAPDGVIDGCVNNGTVEASLLSSTSDAYATNECIIHAGGIGGGDYYVGQDNTQYINCINNGAVNVNLDASKSNSAIGGIVGWPNVEGAIKVAMTKGCKNTGTITLSGHGKARIGGIMGGTGDIIDCVNIGEVKVLSAVENACSVGCIAGFHSQGHVITGCTVNGSATASCGVLGIGGLVGNHGNAAGTIGEGCVINCSINGGTETNSGMLIGYFNGTSKVIHVGTDANPVKIAGGSLNGTAITADNYTSYIWGSGNASEANHIASVVFGE
ncbi:MAG: fibronectin type III domain-containing protein [Candidatus Cryptobacteroides sp.]